MHIHQSAFGRAVGIRPDDPLQNIVRAELMIDLNLQQFCEAHAGAIDAVLDRSDCGPADLGRVTVSTPFVNDASALSVST